MQRTPQPATTKLPAKSRSQAKAAGTILWWTKLPAACTFPTPRMLSYSMWIPTTWLVIFQTPKESTASLKPIATVPAGTNPDAILYEPVTKRVFAFNGRSKDATVLDAAEGKVMATFNVGGKPEFAVADGKGSVYVNVEDTSELLQIDAQKTTILHRWPLAPCKEPSGLAMDRNSRRLFSVCDNEVMAVVDADTGKIVATPKIGQGPDAAAFDPVAR